MMILQKIFQFSSPTGELSFYPNLFGVRYYNISGQFSSPTGELSFYQNYTKQQYNSYY